MSADDIIFGPLAAPLKSSTTLTPTGNGIVRHAHSMSVEILTSYDRSVYTRAATEVMDHIVLEHQLQPKLIDVRRLARTAKGALDLVEITQRFYDGIPEIWISRPQQMAPDQFRFEGRFGYFRVNRMPRASTPIGWVTWSWLDSERGQLPCIDLGLILVPVDDRWYRVFKTKAEAEQYYLS
jgi:hypothetical protein